MYINRFWYLHGKDRATIISCYFAYLENLAIATFPDNFAQLEILRPDLLAFAIDILLAYRHRFYASHFGIVGRTVKKIKKFSLTTIKYTTERGGSERRTAWFRKARDTYTRVPARARDSYSLCNLTRIGIALLLQKENRCGVKSVHVQSSAILKRGGGRWIGIFGRGNSKGTAWYYRAELDDIVVLRLVSVQQSSIL